MSNSPVTFEPTFLSARVYAGGKRVATCFRVTDGLWELKAWPSNERIAHEPTREAIYRVAREYYRAGAR